MLQGITYLNDAFRNRNYYNPQTGVDTEIEFCLAKRDPSGNATTGIVRYQSPYTDMSTHNSHSNLYNLAHWNPVHLTDDSGVTGITMFDFNQDGKNELLYRDETTLRILEGSTGNTLSAWPLKSGTYLEYPIVADVDHDGQAEILINGFQKHSADYRDLRIYCFESAGAPWAPARSVWNQYGYHVTNVNDDLTIPRQPQNQAAVLAGHEDCLLPTCPAPYNAFLTQATYRTQQGCVQWPALDLTIDIIGYECTPDSLIFYLLIDNLGEALLTTDSVFMSCYPIDPIANFETDPLDVTAWYFATDSVTNEIIFTDTIRLSSPIPPGISKMYFTVNDAGLGLDPKYFPFTGIYECSLNNNVDSIDLDISERTLNLGPDFEKCESEVLTLHANSGFKTYAWSDGTQDSTYSSTFSGPHFVETTDNCHRVYRDTVQVTINPATDVELGPDLKLCPGEKYQFNIVGDYDYVQWLPASLVDCDSCMTVAVASDTTQSLFVVVGKGNCYSADTVEIQVLNQVIDAVDTIRICAGDSVLVFGNWLSTDAQISQIYTGFSGCDSTQSFCVKFVSLYEESLQFNICSGDSLLFENQWYTGAGVHRVTVASSTACDTVYTIELIEIPGLFIVDTIRICNHDSIWVNNLWIHAPGLESVAYAGANGCDSVHTTVVLAYETPVWSCETAGGLYIPNVFSPNGDNDNDVWTVIPPKGVLAFDEAYVFDRWGELLAYWQGAPEIGWDGTYKGKLLDAAVFAYFIRYTDVNGQQVEKKGDVTILR